MTGEKPLVVYFSGEQEMVDVVSMTLSERFDVTPVIGIVSLDEALDILRQTKPNFVIVDPDLLSLDHQELSQRIKSDAELQAIQFLIVRDDLS
jgi:CheY-like chemotaxis protein